MDRETAQQQIETSSYALFLYKSTLKVLKSNLKDSSVQNLQTTFTQKFEKGLVYPGIGAVCIVDISLEDGKDSGQMAHCYYYILDVDNPPEQTNEYTEDLKYLVCFMSEMEQSFTNFLTDLNEYCLNVTQPLRCLVVTEGSEVPASVTESLEVWHYMAIQYIVRCRMAMQDVLKFLIHSALMGKSLVLSGGTSELHKDIQRFYKACMSDILSEFREIKQQQNTDVQSDCTITLNDADGGGAIETQNVVTVSFTKGTITLSSYGCNKFCEEWAAALNRHELQIKPYKLKSIVNAFKLKFNQTMNTLKRLLKEAENDYYILYRTYLFLQNSGNSDVLLHYASMEGTSATINILQVLQDCIQKQQSRNENHSCS